MGVLKLYFYQKKNNERLGIACMFMTHTAHHVTLSAKLIEMAQFVCVFGRLLDA